jgi:hypothetical protein
VSSGFLSDEITSEEVREKALWFGSGEDPEWGRNLQLWARKQRKVRRILDKGKNRGIAFPTHMNSEQRRLKRLSSINFEIIVGSQG